MTLMDKLLKAKAETAGDEGSSDGYNPRFKGEKEGDEIAGKVTKITTIQGKYGSTQVLEVEVEGGKKFDFFVNCKVLKDEFEGVEVGHYIGARFLGTAISKKNDRPYQRWACASAPTAPQ